MKRHILPAIFVVAASGFAMTSTGALAQAPIVREPAAQAAPAQTAPMQQRPHHARDPHKVAMHLGKKLGLTPDQTAKLEPVLASQQQKMSDLRANSSLTPQQMHQQMRAIHEDTRTQLAGILTPEQMQQMRAMRREHGHHDGQAVGPGAPATAS